MVMGDKIKVENVNQPGKVTNVNAAKYQAMKTALLKVLPKSEPGLTQREMMDQSKDHLPDALFPGGATSGWWAKCVQLDLEAKGLMHRDQSKPLRWTKQ